MYRLKTTSLAKNFTIEFSKILSEEESASTFGATYTIAGANTDSDKTIRNFIENKTSFDGILEQNTSNYSLTHCFFISRSPLPPYEYALLANIVEKMK